MEAQKRPTPPEGPRRYDLDWLRVIAMLLIFAYHTTRPFDTFESWHVKNTELSDAFTSIRPLFAFVLTQEAALGYFEPQPG